VPLGPGWQAADAGLAPRSWAPPAAPDPDALPYFSQWLRWVFVALVVALVGALWWSRHQAARQESAAVLASNAATAPSAAVAQASAVPRSARQPVSSGSQVGQVAEPRSRREARHAANAAKEQAQPRPDDEPSQPLSPRKACSGKSFILLAICMKRHCVRPEYAGHPECERMRQQEAAQRSNDH
jgi:hypothetical protein